MKKFFVILSMVLFGTIITLGNVIDERNYFSLTEKDKIISESILLNPNLNLYKVHNGDTVSLLVSNIVVSKTVVGDIYTTIDQISNEEVFFRGLQKEISIQKNHGSEIEYKSDTPDFGFRIMLLIGFLILIYFGYLLFELFFSKKNFSDHKETEDSLLVTR